MSTPTKSSRVGRHDIRLRELRSDEVPAAVEVLARGMRDNPIHVAAFGKDPGLRLRALRRMFTGLFGVVRHEQRVCAVDDDDAIVGFMVAAAPGSCRPSSAQTTRMAWPLLPLGPRPLARVGSWQRAWGRHDPHQAHSHFGPLAVDAHLQGRGIGTALLRAYTGRLDAARQLGYLETDKPENIPLYQRHGFVVTGRADVLRTPNWFMERTPR
jgi:ribosomal protein S18 acetylase RimI-like enzyme